MKKRPLEIVVYLAPDTAATAVRSIVEAIEACNLTAFTADDVDTAVERLKQLAIESEPSPAIVMGPTQNSPLAVARALHAAAPNAYLVFVSEFDRLAILRKELSWEPKVGTAWSATATFDPTLPKIISDAALSTAQRRQYRTTLDRMNVQISQRSPVESRDIRRLVLSDRILSRLLIDSIDAIITLDQQGIVRGWNLSAERIFGKREADAIGVQLGEIAVWPAEVLQTFATVPKANGVSRQEISILTSSGRRHVELTINAVRDDDDAFIGSAAIVRDVSERRRASDALISDKHVLERIATGDSLSNVLDLLVRGIEVQSEDGMLCSVLLLDEASQTLLHGSAPSLPKEYNAAIHGLKIGPKVGSCGTAAFERRMISATDLATDPLWEDFRALTKAHQLGSCCSTPIFATDNRVLGTIAMYYRHPHSPSPADIDLTHAASRIAGIVIDQKRAEAQIHQSLTAEREARSEAERLGRMKDEFLATLSHELRTPLNAILGWSQILRRLKVDAEMSNGLEVIERNARAQAQIIEDLLDMSRIISGKVRLDVQRLDLAAIVQAAVETARPAADAKSIRVQPVIDPLRGVVVSGDANRLQQVLWNLLSNAIKFTPKAGRVQVLLERVNSHLEISIIDSGEGIKPEFLPYVFDRFRQADASTTRRHGGLGLGLSIVKQLVELHGGSVRVKSAGLGQGTTFIVTLPLTVVHPEQHELNDVERRHPSVQPLGLSSIDGCNRIAGVRVLVVDDEPDARLLVKRILEDCGAVVTATDSVDTAVELVRSNGFDVVVSDIGMPNEDGYSLIRRIRLLDKSEGGNIPAIALTAYARAEDRIRVISSGFMLHVVKPVEAAELITMVASAAGRTGHR